MLKIRFFRTGRKNQPFYRIVVTDSRNASQGGRFIEKVGFLNPFTKEQELNEERIKHWLSSGAQPTDRVHNMLVEAKVIVGSKVNVLKKKITESTEDPNKEKAPEESKPKEEAVPEVNSESDKNSSVISDEVSVNEEKEEEEIKEKDSDKNSSIISDEVSANEEKREEEIKGKDKEE